MNNEISLCMIIKDEEKQLENCLNSIKDLVDEIIIIIDTRSIDNSKEIAKKFTDMVYDFEWCDDFSKARNYSISKATKGWILILDADEVIADTDKEKIRKIIELNEADAYFFNWRDYFNEIGISGFISTKGDRYKESQVARGFSISKVLRFFKNKKQYFFEGQIHETTARSIKAIGDKIFDTDVVIHHFGSLDKKKLIEKKENYIRLLEKRLEKEDFSEKSKDYVYYELAIELINLGRTEQAIEYLEKAIEISEEYVYLYNLATQYLILNRLEDAERFFKKAIIKSSEYPEKYNYHNPQPYNSFNPSIYLNLGYIYFKRKEYNQAIKKYEKVIELNPTFADAYFNLGIVYRLKGKSNKVEKLFEKAIELNPGFEEKIENLSEYNKKSEVIDVNKSRIFNDLVEYTGIPRREVLQKCADVEKELAELWKQKKSVIEFYQNTDLYLFDLTKYQIILEYNNMIKGMINQIKELKLDKILEFGGGIGEFSLLCYENGLDISYYDLDGKTKDYALWRFKKHNCNVSIEKPDCLDKKWEVINIMDVLEHLENPEEVITELKKNTKFIFCNPNEIQYNELCPQHISKFDLTKDFEHIKGYLWKNKNF